MFKLKTLLTATLIMFAANLSANAGTIGYADFQKVLSEYTYARNAYRDIDNKLLELQFKIFNKDYFLNLCCTARTFCCIDIYS